MRGAYQTRQPPANSGCPPSPHIYIMPRMKNALRTLALITMLILPLLGCKNEAPPQIQGTYYGYEFINSLSPWEPESIWYYEKEMTVDKNKVTLTRSTLTKIKGKVWSSETDAGGLHVYEGAIKTSGERVIIGLRLISCAFCPERSDDPLPSKIQREYIVRFISQDSFELDGVIYKNTPDPKWNWTPHP